VKLIGEIRKQLQELRKITKEKIELKSKQRSLLFTIDSIGNILSNIEDDFLYFSKKDEDVK
jgi:hypothetical protein